MSSKKDEDKQYRIEQWCLAMEQEIARLGAMPLSDLAAEVMIRGFGPGGPGADDDAISPGRTFYGARDRPGPTARDISHALVPERGFSIPQPTAEEVRLLERLMRLVAEGLQQLEHASLVRCQMHMDMSSLDWAATRYGRAALERGDVRAILHGGR
jgi:hypothetical protein